MTSHLDPTALMRDLAAADAASDVRMLLGRLMNSWGGQEKFTDELVLSARAAEVGSSAHLNVMTSVLRAFLQYGDAGDDDDGLDEESIRAEMNEILQKEQAASDERKPLRGDA